MYYNLKIYFFLSRSIQFRLIFTIRWHKIRFRWIFVMTPKLLWCKSFTLQACRSLQSLPRTLKYNLLINDLLLNLVLMCKCRSIMCGLSYCVLDHHEPMSMLVQVQRQKMDTAINLLHTRRLLCTGGAHIKSLTGMCCSNRSVLIKNP